MKKVICFFICVCFMMQSRREITYCKRYKSYDYATYNGGC